MIVTDNGSNMVAAFKNHLTTHHNEDEEDDGESDTVDESTDTLSDSEEEDFLSKDLDRDLVFGSFIKRVPCFAHTLQLVIRKFDKENLFKTILKNAHALVSKINKSTKATEKLKSLCGKKLVSDCPTRWSSTYLLLEHRLEVRNAVKAEVEELEWYNLHASEWKVLENICKLLQPFAQYATLVSGDQYTTMSAIVPIIMEIKLHLE